MTDLLDSPAHPDTPARQPLRRRLVGSVALAVVLALFGLCWLITGPMRTAGRLQEIVGIRWVLAGVSHDGRTAPVARLGDHTLELDATGLVTIFDGCNYTTGEWSWTMSGFDIADAANGAIACGYLPGTEPPPTDPIVVDGNSSLHGWVSAKSDDLTLTVGSDGYTLTYLRG